MPLDRFVLIVVCVIAAAGATVWIAGAVIAGLGTSPVLSLVALIPLALVAAVLWRVIADRIRSREDSHYDGIER